MLHLKGRKFAMTAKYLKYMRTRESIMKIIKIITAMFIFFLLGTYLPTYAQSLAINSQMDFLSPLEKEIVRELNYARTNPQKYASVIEDLKQYYDGNLIKVPDKTPIRTREGVKAVDEAIRYLRSVQPLPPLKVSQGMSQAARDHVKDQGSTTMTGHKGRDGSSSFDRLNRYGQWQYISGENISYGAETARDVVAQLIIDDGVPSRSHRKNIFNHKFRICGVACGSHALYRHMCVITFAGGYQEKR
jgi:uncharacterized protein YkwD